jgi:hypothetical protein
VQRHGREAFLLQVVGQPSHSTWVLANTMAWLMVVSRSQWSSSLRLCCALSAQNSTA